MATIVQLKRAIEAFQFETEMWEIETQSDAKKVAYNQVISIATDIIGIELALRLDE